jgi:Uncharacterised nucleotidyltransferase
MASWTHGETPPPRPLQSVEVAPRSSSLWTAVDGLVDRAPRISDLTFHGLHLLAARRYRQTGRLVPRDVATAERASAVLTIVVPAVLEQIRRAYGRTIVLMKGPEAASYYPDPALRPFRDLDLLVPDADEAQQELLAAGFVTAGSPEPYVDLHHLQPLQWPGAPLLIEVHDRPKWPAGLPLPSRAELLASAVAGSTGVPGILAPAPELHAMVIAAHSWAHAPLGRLVHLVDLKAVTATLDRHVLDQTAASLGMRRVWRASIGAADALFDDGPSTWPLRLWARNLPAAREPTVLESHLGRWLPPWLALSPRAALRANVVTISREVTPRNEAWSRKLRRTLYAFRNAAQRRSDHDRAFGEERP